MRSNWTRADSRQLSRSKKGKAESNPLRLDAAVFVISTRARPRWRCMLTANPKLMIMHTQTSKSPSFDHVHAPAAPIVSSAVSCMQRMEICMQLQVIREDVIEETHERAKSSNNRECSVCRRAGDVDNGVCAGSA